ncbi:Protein N-acetyltransferase, RimJ/RimL family [Pedococcus dokdonensis]|uniref:Protein N-acetyltransferase, RimJ/RimL family n=1 Tax=Pedococcus dokdonensis TaxID=443156 RepID=A0A1H0QAX3_9MICO|nr:GNAT family protein [Pedococcus dokdonensis]SDP14523.1 Protein N-acetyltransferase, RimJ/RimL family [Pedococcus dokdonensis]
MPRVSLPITTERLVLRTLLPRDVDDVLAYRSQPDVVRYIPGDPRDREQVADMVAHYGTAGLIDEKRAHLTLAVDRGGRVIGDVMLAFNGPDGADGRQCELGWVFTPDVQGQGYATEAARALLKVAFSELGVHRVWAQLDGENTASARLCERLGMQREAYLVQGSWFKEQWTDLAIYAIRADEWSAEDPS